MFDQFPPTDIAMRSFIRSLFGENRTTKHEIVAPIIPFAHREITAEYRAILQQMNEIMQRNSCFSEMELIEEAIFELDTESLRFAELVTGRGIWGGAGSISDCLFEANTRSDRKQARLDDTRLVRLLAQLVRRLVIDGMKNPRIESLGEVYERTAHQRTTEKG